MSEQDEGDSLREEIESLAAFLHLLQREHAQLHADFASALRAAGGQIAVERDALRTSPVAERIERVEDRTTGALTFRLREPTS